MPPFLQTAILIGLICGICAELRAAFRAAEYPQKIVHLWTFLLAAFALTFAYVVTIRALDYNGICDGSIGDPRFPCTRWEFLEDDLRLYSLLIRLFLWNTAGLFSGILIVRATLWIKRSF